MSKIRWAIGKAATVFYALVVIEVIVMISPFAFYWYSFYSPTLQAFHRWRATAWLESFILPHSVITQSTALEFFRWGLGPYLFSIGIWAFMLLAIQIYTAKLRRKGLVTGGLYRYIRHPQYLSLSLAGIGLLTIWPRMIIFILLLVMMSAYYLLARLEERRLLKHYPETEDYYRQTAMFIPGNPGGKIFGLIFGGLRNQTLARGLSVSLALAIGIVAGFALRAYTIASSEKTSIPEAKTLAISVWPQGSANVERVVRLALNEESISTRLEAEGAGSYTAHLLPANYGMVDMFTDLKEHRHMDGAGRYRMFGNIMMSLLLPFTAPDLKTRIMGSPNDQYRVIVSRVDGPGQSSLPLSEVTKAKAKMTAVLVVDVDGASNEIININLDPPRRSYWGDITMPMF